MLDLLICKEAQTHINTECLQFVQFTLAFQMALDIASALPKSLMEYVRLLMSAYILKKSIGAGQTFSGMP